MSYRLAIGVLSSEISLISNLLGEAPFCVYVCMYGGSAILYIIITSF